MGWADDMYEAGYTSTHGGLMDEHDDEHDDVHAEWENKAFWESLNISEDKLSKFCFTRILDVGKTCIRFSAVFLPWFLSEYL